MTDTGQIPGEGLPENAGMVEQPGAPAPGAYTYLSETTAEDEDLLLLPGAQSAWGNEVAPPPPEPVVEAVHEPEPHETSGRDTGSVDLSGVRPPGPAVPPRRPLHLGPPIPSTSASPVRSLADRGPADAPRPVGPEYLDASQSPAAPPRGAAPWGPGPAETVVPTPRPAEPGPVGPVAGESPVENGPGPRGPEPAVPQQHPEPAPQQHQAAEAPETPETREMHDPQTLPATTPTPAPQTPDDPAAEAAGASPVATEVPVAAEAPEVPVASEVPVAPEASVVPEASVASEVPVVPEASVASEVPVVPEASVASEVPVASGTSVASEVPVGFEVPVASEVPVTPEVSVGPEVPVTPEVSVASEVFVAPEAQVAPEVQVAPETPAASEAAGAHEAAVAPEMPVAAETAAASEVPGTPETPAVSEAPVAPVVEEAPAAPETAVAPEPPAAPLVDEAPVAPEAPATPLVDEAPVAPETPVAPPTDEATVAPPTDEAPVAPLAEAAPPAPEAPVTPPVHAPAPAEEVPAAPEPPATPLAEAAPAAPPVEEAPPTPEAPPVQAPQPSEPTSRPPQTAGEAPTAAPLTPDPEQAPPAPAPAPFPAEPEPSAEQPAPAEDPAPVPLPAAQGPQTTVPAPDGAPAEPVAQFEAADGQVPPAPPHLAPAPPHDAAAPGLVQHADDLDTRAAEQDDVQAEGVAPVAETGRRSVGPAAPAYDDAEREAVLKVMRERRDIRNGFRDDPIPHEVLLRVLEAAHTAPSVGHSQPWDFVVIRSAETRRTMHELATRQREAYAKSLPKGRAKQFKELKIEAILDTPVNIVVTADPTRGGRHTLGRHTQPQMAPYSAALAVENLWLAARAEGLGVGWVSFFDEREMVRALGLPEHLEVIAYLCVGYVDEFPDEPELMQAGWSKRRPLSWVVHEETYGRRALPGEEPHDLLAETVAQIRPLDAKALGEAWERQKRMTKPAGALGMLEIISAQLSGLSRQCPPPIPEPAAVAIFAGDHGVHAQGVTPWPQEVTAQMVANFLGGGAVCNAFATQVGAEVCIVDVGVAADLPATPGLLPRKIRPGTSDMTAGPAMTREEAKQAIEVGIETARDLVAAGNKALLTGEMGIANTTASAALISVFTGADPAEVTGRGTGINDETLARKTEVVRRALEVHRPDPADPIGVLAAVGGLEHAAMVGLLLGGASLRTPVILDGVSAGAAALVARAIAPEVLAACIAGHRSAEPGHVAALNKLGLRPLVDLDLRLGEGTGALLALPMVQSTARAMHEVATFDSAGVTEK
ncbi:nicotinate-nucleotide--dimethylbenzimidazole phosphoribosyltransferase [Streptomyces sp. NPDC005876]|uniref:nicotinate-nucleotide--dimethylbenzimidazole phosphoribosyltransferase n=1 Tax=Streptomyces sp. NPDC005876 TaxID=3157076 RepID=UPI0033C76A14